MIQEKHVGFDVLDREAEIHARSRELFPDYEPIDVDAALKSARPQELEVMRIFLKLVGIQVLPPLLQELDQELRCHYLKNS